MKGLRMVLLMMLAVILVFYLASCENAAGPSDDLIDAIKDIVLADSVVMLDGFDDGGAADADYEQGLAKAVLDTFPLDYFAVRFGRRITGKPERDVVVEISGDTAVAEITSTIYGKFIIHYVDTTNHVLKDSVIKDFTVVTKQRVKLYKYRSTRNPKRNWKVVAFTPIVGRTEGSDLEILSVCVDHNGEEIFSIQNDSTDSILNFYIGRETFVNFRPNVTLHVKMSVANPTPFIYEPGEVALVHYGVRRGIMKARRRLTDPENDDVFEGLVRMHGHGSHMCRTFFDLIDMATIFDKGAPVNSTFWALPYRVRRH